MLQRIAGSCQVGVCLAAVALLGCSALPEPQTGQFLDEHTGISLTVVDKPLILARERRYVAANARDYLTLVAAERNQAGRRQLLLLAHRWSTIDTRTGDRLDSDATQLVLVVDGRDFKLTPLSPSSPHELSQSEKLWRPKVSEVITLAYGADRTLLANLAQGKEISAFFVSSSAVQGFTAWQDGRDALRRFLNTVGGAR